MRTHVKKDILLNMKQLLPILGGKATKQFLMKKSKFISALGLTIVFGLLFASCGDDGGNVSGGNQGGGNSGEDEKAQLWVYNDSNYNINLTIVRNRVGKSPQRITDSTYPSGNVDKNSITLEPGDTFNIEISLFGIYQGSKLYSPPANMDKKIGSLTGLVLEKGQKTTVRFKSNYNTDGFYTWEGFDVRNIQYDFTVKTERIGANEFAVVIRIVNNASPYRIDAQIWTKWPYVGRGTGLNPRQSFSLRFDNVAENATWGVGAYEVEPEAEKDDMELAPGYMYTFTYNGTETFEETVEPLK